jgi:hypothetical protein
MLVVAAFEDVFFAMIPIAALMIPIVAILTYHQRKMAEIIHGSQAQSLPNPEVEYLRREVLELKQIVHQQTIAIDNFKQLPPRSSSPPQSPEVQ